MEAVSRLLTKRLDESTDKNIGSARGTSTSAFVSTLVVNLVIFAVLVLIFAVLRRSNRRIYAPRTYVSCPPSAIVGATRQGGLTDIRPSGWHRREMAPAACA